MRLIEEYREQYKANPNDALYNKLKTLIKKKFLNSVIVGVYTPVIGKITDIEGILEDVITHIGFLTKSMNEVAKINEFTTRLVVKQTKWFVYNSHTDFDVPIEFINEIKDKLMRKYEEELDASLNELKEELKKFENE